ncbi:MAG: DUF2757 domain-containing protein [Sulfobacillus thermosulfidooxidans]|uniref:DUF2757 domain-containing protein n=1 Tax=Sulfobacillus thermosulfidooxidans TaxID=28034 RepID=A0A2T2X2X8_SULTH|nr:MAG: DUF2757 domain-containing protein [Sulfobacillus thermosulfidooxidans]
MVVYRCRHCHRIIGEYGGPWDDPLLGLSKLTPSEQRDMLQDIGPDRVQVNVLCEGCLPIPYDEGLWYN